MRFIRSTHNKHNKLKEDLGTLDPICDGLFHMLTDNPMTINEVILEIAKYNCNFNATIFSTDEKTVALALIRLCEAGYAKCVN